MYVKKNLILWAAVFALAIPLFFAGTVSAKYMSDGAVQNGSTGGWNTPSDGICVIGLHTDGTMDVDATITNKRDCDARLVSITASTSGDTLANVCGNVSKNTNGILYAAPGSNTCVTIDSNGYITGSKSMKNLDRNAVMCNKLGGQLASATTGTLANGAVIATATKTVANGTAATCIAYGWQYRYQDADGTPLTFGATGVSPASSGTGFCYTTVMTGITPTTACPSAKSGSTLAVSNAKLGYSVTNAVISGTTTSVCAYSYGIKGAPTTTLTAIDGTKTYGPDNAVDLSGATQGQCLSMGASWANGWGFVTTGTTTDFNSSGATVGVVFDQAKQALNSDEGCLHCHSYKAQQNGPAERFKDSYVLTGHKNMLRAVTAGKNWAGPVDGVLTIYTTDGTNTIDFTSAGPTNTAGVTGSPALAGGSLDLYYVYGDWMASAPTLATAASNTNILGYSCYACHATGASDSSGSVPGVQSIGISDYKGLEPQATFPGIIVNGTKNNAKWDLNGIQCGRCHNATVPAVSQSSINASGYKTTYSTGTGMGNIPSGPAALSTYSTYLCFGCHQSMASAWPAGAKQWDPTLIPVGVSHGAAYGRDFNGHVLGNSFLNSAHGLYSGVNSTSAKGGSTLNALGKNDLISMLSTTTDSNTALYKGTFQGYTCWQSSASSSPAKTRADGSEITNKTDCESLYGTGAWRSDNVGSCTTCHDVHNSMFVEEQKEKSLRKKCGDCHVYNAATGATIASAPQVSVFQHPMRAGTPFDVTKYEDSCVVCHMASQAVENGDQTSMPPHLWRINCDANYNTFPTMAQFYSGVCSVHTSTVQNAPYLPVVYASDTSAANCTANGGVWTGGTPTNRNATMTADGAVWVDLDLACGQCHGGSLGASSTHNGAPYYDKNTLAQACSIMHTPVQVISGVSTATSATPVVSHSTPTITGFSVSFTDTSSDPDGTTDAVRVNWGDGTIVTGLAGDTFTHLYSSARARAYSITHAVTDAVNPRLIKSESFRVSVPTRYTISGTVSLSTGSAFSGPGNYVYLKAVLNTTSGTVIRTVQSRIASNGTYTFTGVLPASGVLTGNYVIHPYKYRYSFTDYSINGLGADVVVPDIQGVKQ